MGPAAIILAAASLAGGILGGKRKQIDINWLRQNFGPDVVNEETVRLMNDLINSPYGQSLMANASEQGQQFEHDTNRAAAAAGFGAGGGAESGSSVFATSAAKGAGSALQRGVSSDFYKIALPMAQKMVSDRMSAYLGNLEGYQDNSARLWQSIGNAAGTAGAMIQPGTQKPSAPGGSEPYTSNMSLWNPNTGDINPYDQFGTSLLPAAKLPSVQPILPLRSSRFSGMQGAIQPRTAYA